MDATVQDRETPLQGKPVRIRPRTSTTPLLGNIDRSGQEGTVEKLQLVTTCHGDALLSYWVRFADGGQGTFTHSQFDPL